MDFNRPLQDAVELGNSISRHPEFRELGFLSSTKLLNRFVKAMFSGFKTDNNDVRALQTLTFSDALKLGRGVCLEQSQFLALLLLETGQRSTLVTSDNWKGMGHMWVEVSFGGETYIFDPVNRVAGLKSDLKNDRNIGELGDWYFNPAYRQHRFEVR